MLFYIGKESYGAPKTEDLPQQQQQQQLADAKLSQKYSKYFLEISSTPSIHKCCSKLTNEHCINVKRKQQFYFHVYSQKDTIRNFRVKI